MASRFPMQPVGRNSAASRSKISAARRSRRLRVGSSPYTSSPTSASAMARRMAGVGRVTVSLRRSTTEDGAGTIFSLAQKFDEHFVRDGQAIRREPQALAIKLHEAAFPKCRDSLAQADVIDTLEAAEIDAFELTQAEKNFLVECLPRRHRLELLAHRIAAGNRGHVLRGIVLI